MKGKREYQNQFGSEQHHSVTHLYQKESFNSQDQSEMKQLWLILITSSYIQISATYIALSTSISSTFLTCPEHIKSYVIGMQFGLCCVKSCSYFSGQGLYAEYNHLYFRMEGVLVITHFRLLQKFCHFTFLVQLFFRKFFHLYMGSINL